MKILVPLKRVLDFNIKARVKSDKSGIDLANCKMSMNPFDEIAVEEAVRLRETAVAQQVTVVSIGVDRAQENLRTALAMGADRAILIRVDDIYDTDIEPLAVARLLAKLVQEEQIDLVIMGKQAIDNEFNATGQMLAAKLSWAQATYASEIKISGKRAKVTREVDRGTQHIAVDLPAVITVDLSLNEPRYVSLPNIIKGRKKPLSIRSYRQYADDIEPRLTVLSTTESPVRRAGIMVESVSELVERLKAETEVP